MSKVPVNPFALGAAFVERAVELGWVEVDSDGRRSSYYLTPSGSEGLENFGVKIEKAMQFAILPERTDSAPKRRAASSMQANRGSLPMHRGPVPSHGRPAHRGPVSHHGGAPHRGRHGESGKDRGRHETHIRGERHPRHERHGELRKRTEP